MKRAVLLLLLAIALAPVALGDTNVSGNIGADTTWTLAGSPYILTGNVTVGGPAAPTLTIEAGVVVKGNGSSQILVNFYDKGALVANGTEAAPILFTANGSTAKGYWFGLRFGAIAGAPASSMSYATVEYAGSTYYDLGGITILAFSPTLDHITSRQHQQAGIKIEGGTPSITSATIRDSGNYGIYVTGGAPALTDVALLSNTGVAVSGPANTQYSGMTGLSATGNGTNGVEFRAGTIAASRTWKTCAIPYIVTGNIYVQDATAPILTIEQGNAIRFNNAAQIAVNFQNKGGLAATGASASPIVFTTNAATPTAGSWLGLYFGEFAGGPASSMSYATVEYGGSTYYQRGGATIQTLSPAFDHVTLRNNAFAGAAVYGGSPSFTASAFTSNGGPGIQGINASTLTLTGVAFTSNSGYAATVPCTTVFTDTSGLTATGNTGGNSIELRAGTITASTTWPLSAIPYVVSGTINVEGASAPILTIAAGNTVKFNNPGQLSVNHGNKGGLQANGTAGAPILFTSNGTQSAGYWQGLWFGPTTTGPQSNVSYATIEYGGNGYYQRGGITVHALSPAFDHVTFSNNAFGGAVLYGGSPSITNSTITATNGGPGIYGLGGTSLTLTSVAFTNNGGHAVTLPVSVVLNDASGLTATGNGTGRDAIEYRAGTITANTTWPLSTIPYVVTGTINVEAASAPVLTIAAGNTVKFNNPGQISVNHGNKGALQANGTAGSTILFTSNGTQSAGFWQGLWFGPTAGGPQSNVSYATIEYGGNGYYQRGGITVNALAPIFDHVTLRNNAFGGAVLYGGAPVIRDSTITTTGGPGVYALSGNALTLTNDAFTNNAGQAVTLPVSVILADASGLTASGNGTGRDSIEYRAGTITVNTMWPLASIPYVVTGTINVEAPVAPVLTIAAGNTIRFNDSAQISVNHGNKGALQANGTPSAPILFTSNGTGIFWQGLWFGPTVAGPQSNVSYATIEYGGNGYWQRGGITVNALAPAFDHLIIRNSTFAGLMAVGNSTPHITNTHFLSNPEGIKFTSPAKVFAELNYWNTAIGPCLPGSCATGQQSAATGVNVEPWLTSAPTNPQYVASALIRNRAFSPSIGATFLADYTTALSGPATFTIRNATNGVVRTFNSSATTGSVVWDGKNDLGVLQPDGTYTYELVSTAAPDPPGAIAKGLAIIDSTRSLSLSNPAVSQSFFSPNADTVQDTTTVTAATNYDDAAWTLTVVNAASTVVRTQTGSGTTVSFIWDGKDDGAALQPDGVYTLSVEASEGTANVKKSVFTTLDNTPPAVALATPAASEVLSNVYMNGATNVTPTGSVGDTNLLNWTTEFGSGAAPTSWSTIGAGTVAVTAGNLGSWPTANSVNGAYALRLRATDKAGNPAATTTPVVIGNFKVVQSAYQLNGAAGGTLTYTSTVPFPLTESIVVKNEAGAVVRNLVTSAARNAGTFNDAFNGRNDANALIADGALFFFATVTDGTHTFTWDLSNDYRNDYFSYNDGLGIQAYDPYNNKPLKFTYNFAQPGRVSIATSTNPGSVIGNCAAPTATFFCPAIYRWEAAGPHTFVWSGIDYTGAYRTVKSFGIVINTNNFPRNALVLFGTKPTVDNVKVTPPVFGPAVGTQTIEFDVASYQSQTVDVSIALINLSNLSTLRTLTIPSQTAGHVTKTWDGRADNGMLIAPGFYRMLVSVTDSIGNVANGDILTTIQY